MLSASGVRAAAKPAVGFDPKVVTLFVLPFLGAGWTPGLFTAIRQVHKVFELFQV
jgi:hypothetical protein